MPSGRRLPEHIVSWLSCAMALAGLSGCFAGDEVGEVSETAFAAITGSVTYSEYIPLTDRATVEIQLLDVSTEGEATVVSSQRIRIPGQVPILFRLDYAPEQIDPARRYTVQARIFEGDDLRFATDTAYPVITHGNPHNVRITTIPIGLSQQAASAIDTESSLESTLTTGDVSATYSAQFAGNTLVSIQEDRVEGSRGRVGAEYQFKEGRLLRYVELGRRTPVPGSAAPDQVELDFAFDDTGELLAARKTVNDRSAQPTLAEIDTVRNRADLLRNHALATRATREHERQ